MAHRSPASATTSARLEAVSFEVADARSVAGFWAELLGRTAVEEPGAVFLPGSQTQVGLRFVTVEPDPGSHSHLHLHVTSGSLEDQQRTVDEALRLGGHHLDVGQAADETFVVLADPGGNAWCVIEPGNRYLDGAGHLGEVTCDGSRAVGHFWSRALGWPLVWDEGEQTAIQSPLGGTKISWDAWDETPGEPSRGPYRERFDLVSPDVAHEVNRLVSLGAVAVADQPERVELTDPDGHAFSLRAG